jgi:hypothetical protein
VKELIRFTPGGTKAKATPGGDGGRLAEYRHKYRQHWTESSGGCAKLDFDVDAPSLADQESEHCLLLQRALGNLPIPLRPTQGCLISHRWQTRLQLLPQPRVALPPSLRPQPRLRQALRTSPNQLHPPPRDPNSPRRSLVLACSQRKMRRSLLPSVVVV